MYAMQISDEKRLQMRSPLELRIFKTLLFYLQLCALPKISCVYSFRRRRKIDDRRRIFDHRRRKIDEQ